MKDEIFNQPIKKQFEFDESVATVFDDMLQRSVPFYEQSMQLVVDLLALSIEEGDVITDLGCSTASMLLNIEQKVAKKVTYIGVDNAPAMLDQARKKIMAYGSTISLVEADILNYAIQPSNIILTNYTLQFIRPLDRVGLVQKIYDALEESGRFIFSEKVISEDKQLNKQMIDLYYGYKQDQGYSAYEIMQKREALENVLIPYSEEENKKMMREVGFQHIETLFRWNNFVTFIAIK
jgi:tRNA (cmo5U34)-methyltransferase